MTTSEKTDKDIKDFARQAETFVKENTGDVQIIVSKTSQFDDSLYERLVALDADAAAAYKAKHGKFSLSVALRAKGALAKVLRGARDMYLDGHKASFTKLTISGGKVIRE